MGTKFTLGGPTPPGRPYRRNFFTQSEYFTIFNCVFNFNILALVSSEILRGFQIYTRGHTPLGRPLAEKYCLPKASTSQYLIVFLVLTF